MRRALTLATLAAALAAPAAARADDPTLTARRYFFGAENVDAQGRPNPDKVILSWFSVSSLAAAIDGHVVLLDTYIHKGEPYVPATTDQLVALKPEAVFIGHGHVDHANTAGEIVARTGAVLVGTPEHCDQTKQQAQDYAGHPVDVHCVATVDRGSAIGAETREISPLGPDVCITVLKHVHSDVEVPDSEHVANPSLVPPPLADPGLVLMHPPGAGVLAAAGPGDEGSSLLYQFRVGRFALTWNDTAGPMREKAPNLPKVLAKLPPTDVEAGAVLGLNYPTDGMRDPVDYVEALKPKVFFPLHHDFVNEYGASRQTEGVFRREMAARGDLTTDVRWLYDPYDYVRPGLMTFDVRDPRWAQDDGRGTCGRRIAPHANAAHRRARTHRGRRPARAHRAAARRQAAHRRTARRS